MRLLRIMVLHGVLWVFVGLTLVPFVFVVNNSFRSNTELYHSFFGLPSAVKDMAVCAAAMWGGNADARITVETDTGDQRQVTPREAVRHFAAAAVRGYKLGWQVIRRYLLNTFFVCGMSALGVVITASIAAYTLSRYRFFGHRAIFFYIISAIMFPAALTFVPSFMLVKELGLLNSYWVMILPYVAGGQVFATFIFKSFFDGLPEDLFESARMDGAGHLQIYRNIVLPLSKPVVSVVTIMTVFGTWNNFLWPFVTLSDDNLHPIASGLFVMATSSFNQNLSTVYAAYVVSSLPLLVLFIYATKPFIQGVTSGAFKA